MAGKKRLSFSSSSSSTTTRPLRGRRNSELGQVVGVQQVQGHKVYKDLVKKGLNPLEHKPNSYIKDEDWRWMCEECFENPTWQKRSTVAAANRSKLRNNHVGGSKSLVQYSEEAKIQSSGDSSGESSKGSNSLGKYFEVFKRTHWTDKRGWQSEQAEAKYNKMIELRTEHLTQLPESTQLSSDDEEEIYSQVLVDLKKERYDFKRGMGPVPKKKTADIYSERLIQQKVIEDLQNEAQDSRRRMSEMEARLNQQQELIQKLLQQLNPPSEHSGHSFQRHEGPPPPPPPPAPVC